MLHKLFGVNRLTPNFFRHVPPKQAAPSSAPAPPPEAAAAVKIIHVGGIVEYYYMAIPARGIMEKYPSFILARPEIFRRPWEALVRPEEILTPGQKFYVVPRRTVKKLQRRIRRPTGESSIDPTSDKSSIDISIGSLSRSYMDSFSQDSTDSMSKSFKAGKSGAFRRDAKPSASNRPTYNPPASLSKDSECTQKTTASARPRKPKRVRKAVMWNPTLTVIREGATPARGGAED